MASLPAPSPPLVFLDADALSRLLPFPLLLSHLSTTLPLLSSAIISPQRLTYPLPSSSPSCLLLMPSWSTHPSLPYIGVKSVTSFPSSTPSVAASYCLFSSLSGKPLAALDGTHLTLLRTASVAALAAKCLAAPSPSVLLLVGAGNLGLHVASAHLAALPSISTVLIYNRTASKAADLAASLAAGAGGRPLADCRAVESVDAAMAEADVVCCATGATAPLVKGSLVKPGTHIGLIGSFTPAMKESDDELMRKGRLFIDCEAAAEEAGEIVGAVERGVLLRSDIVGTLADLLGGTVAGRRNGDEVTVFKSVGSAVFDLLAAQAAVEAR